MGPIQPINVSEDALIKHRLEQLEELAAGWHAAERRVDTLALSVAAVEKSIAGIEASLEKNAIAMERMHGRLDEALKALLKAEAREEGRASAQAKTWKVIAWTVTAMIMLMGAVVALLNLVTS